jgi:membrane protease YdiL (CAAX protease family)
MTETPTGILASVLLAAVFGLWWLRDYRQHRQHRDTTDAGNADDDDAADAGNDAANALPGATPCPANFVALGAAGAALLVLLETLGENALGVSAEQKNITALFLAAMLAAAIVEEIVFRGFLVITGKGRAALLAGIVAASVLFALAHDFLWSYTPDATAAWWEIWRGFTPNLTAKAAFSTTAIFLGSLYFYLLRFHPKNRQHSLLPCFAAHAAKNLTVFAVKLAQGHVIGLW